VKRYNILTLTYKIGEDVIEVHPVLIQEGKELILCDAGYPNQIEQIESELNKFGFGINDLTKVLISHHDHDHIGSLASLKARNPSLQVMASEIEKPFINQTLSEEARAFGELFANYLATINTVKVDITVKGDDYIANGVKIISTPGHTPGHLSVLLEEESVLFVGDALAYENDQFTIANPEFTLDIDACIKSIRKIKNMQSEKIICYHGGLVASKISDALSELLQKSDTSYNV